MNENNNLTNKRVKRSNAGSRLKTLIKLEQHNEGFEVNKYFATEEDENIDLLFQNHDTEDLEFLVKEDLSDDSNDQIVLNNASDGDSNTLNSDMDEILTSSDSSNSSDEPINNEQSEDDKVEKKKNKSYSIQDLKKMNYQVAKKKKKKIKKSSIGNGNSDESLRSSTRITSIQNKKELYNKLMVDEIKKSKLPSTYKNTFVEPTQEEKLMEALETEKKNALSVTLYEEQENIKKEQQKKLQLQKKQKLINVIRFTSKEMLFNLSDEEKENQNQSFFNDIKFPVKKKHKRNFDGKINAVQHTFEKTRNLILSSDSKERFSITNGSFDTGNTYKKTNFLNENQKFVYNYYEDSDLLKNKTDDKISLKKLKRKDLRDYNSDSQISYFKCKDDESNSTNKINKMALDPIEFKEKTTDCSTKNSNENFYVEDKKNQSELLKNVNANKNTSNFDQKTHTHVYVRNNISFIDFENNNYNLKNNNDFIKTILFGKQSTFPGSRKFKVVETILKIKKDDKSDFNTFYKDEIFQSINLLTENNKIFEDLKQFTHLGDNPKTHKIVEKALKTEEIQFSFKTLAPTGIYLPNGSRKKCMVSGLQVKYFNPNNGIPYNSIETYKLLKLIEKGNLCWLNMDSEQSDNGPFQIYISFKNGLQKHAKGVPEGFDCI